MAPAQVDHCYWIRNARAQHFEPMREDVEVDVAIIGGGIVGTIAARLLKDSGQTVAIVEAGRVGQGVTGRSTAKVTAQHSLFLQRIAKDHGEEAARTYADANRAGVALIADLVARLGLRCDWEPADSFVYALTEDGARSLELERDAASRAGLPMELTMEAGLPFAITAALRLPGQFQFQPADFVAALAATIPGDGSHVFEDSRAIDWSETSVTAVQGTVRAPRVIMATHLPLGQVGQFHAHNHPHMHAIMAVPVEPARAPAGLYISADQPKRSLRRHRAANGDMVLILTGPTFKHGDAAAEEDGFRQLDDFAREHFGCDGGGWRWSNEDYAPRDGLPYVGWAGATGRSLLVATGFDAWGLSNGAAAAILLADLCEGRDNGWSERFDASRHTLSGLGKLVSEGVKVTADLVGGHLHPRHEGLSGAAEGDIVDIGGRTAGVFRDVGGKLRAVSAVCSHMGCLLGWNPVDRTWDCSCHGSRFEADGRVAHGPAVEPLSALALNPGQEELEP